MALPELFLREAQSQDASLISLPQDMDLWAETIVSRLREKLPQSRDMGIKISFLKKDEELGTATGSAVLVHRKLNKTIYVPIIVKNFNMCPLDIMMLPKKGTPDDFETVPLTADIFNEAIFSSDVFDHLGKPLDRIRQLYGDSQGHLQFPPTYRNIHASAQIIDSIMPDIWKEDVKEFVQNLKNNPQVLIGYEKRANLDILRKIAQANGRDEEIREGFRNITIINKDSNGSYKTITTSDEAYDPIIETIDKDTFKNKLDDEVERTNDTLNEVDRNGVKIVFKDLSPESAATVASGVHDPAAYQKVSETPVEAKVFGTYKVQDKNLVFHRGVVFPNVIGYDMNVLNTKIFCGNQKAAYQTALPGIKIEGESPMSFLKFREPQVGMTGTFVTKNKTNALATFPVTIRSVVDDCGKTLIVAMDLNGKKIKLKWSCFMGDEPQDLEEEIKDEFSLQKDLQKIVKVKDFYIIPRCFKFLPLDNFVDLAEAPASIIQKQASAVRDSAPIRVIHTGGSQFALKGPDIVKMASQVQWHQDNLSAAQAVFLLAAKRCPLTKVAEALKAAGMCGESSVHGLPRIDWDYGKGHMKLASLWMKAARALRVNLIKEASYFDDTQVVDSILSLNFINPDNITKFVSFIPIFEQTSKYLAQALLASRLGMTEIPEQETASAMHKMLEVIKGLKRLSLRNGDEQ